MSLVTKVVLIAALILSIIIPFGAFLFGERKRGRLKTALVTNLFMFFGLFVVANIMVYGGTAFAAESAVQNADGLATGLGYIAAALVTGLSGIGGGIATAAAASAALGAISEDGSILGKSLIFVGMAEGVCLYGLIISFMILGKL